MQTENLIIIVILIGLLSCMSVVCVMFSAAYLYKEFIYVETISEQQQKLADKAVGDVKVNLGN